MSSCIGLLAVISFVVSSLLPVGRVRPRLELDNNYAAAVRSVKFSTDCKLIAAVGDSTSINVWDARSGKVILQPRDLQQVDLTDQLSVDFFPDGKTLVVGDINSTVRFIAIHEKNISNALKGHGGKIVASPDGSSFVTFGSVAQLRYFSVNPVKGLAVVASEKLGNPVSASFSPDSKLLAIGTDDSRLLIFSTNQIGRAPGRALDLKQKKEPHPPSVDSIAISNDLRCATVTCRDGFVQVWDIVAQERLATIKGSGGGFVQGSKYVLVVQRDTVVVLDLSTKKMTDVPLGTDGMVHSVAISPDGLSLAVGYDDGAIRIWDVRSLLWFAVVRGGDR